MSFDFTPVENHEMTMLQFSENFTVEDLRNATNESIDTLLKIVRVLNDEQVAFLPVDPEADDPYAKPGEEKIGWSIAHLVVHATATSEEWATYSSFLSRGIPYPAEPRLRYETEWKTVTTTAQCIQRLEESRRIRLSYLAAWPDVPNLEIKRELSPRFIEKFGEFNAAVCFLFGLKHELGHYAQFREVARQAKSASQVSTAGV
ncbi:MAG: DinB family protein [Chloroflexota bacterium]